MKGLLSLLYVSNAQSNLSDTDIQAILEVSRSNNLKEDITGVLCSGGGHFIQVLEGPQKNVLGRYLQILEDERHTDCLLIGVAPLKARNFNDWSMGYIHASETVILERKKLLVSYLESQFKGTELVNQMRRLLQLITKE
jgi:hypothetical protein